MRQGEIVAIPTETVYGLAGRASDDLAVAKIFAAKERPAFNPLIVHVASLEEAERIAVFDERAIALAEKFWPGPLTLVLPRREGVSLLATAGLETVGVRVPAHSVAREVLRLSGPLAAPSANRSGRLSPTKAEHVEIGSWVLDGGECGVGIESTIIGVFDSPVLLRPGVITKEEIEEAAGKVAEAGGKVIAPGMLARHYAPTKPLRLNAENALPGEAAIGFGKNIPAGAGITRNLSEKGDLPEAASRLFSTLHELDAMEGVTGIAAAPIPEEGIGRAINDRLRRGADFSLIPYPSSLSSPPASQETH